MPTGIYERKLRNKYPVEWTHSNHENVFVSGMQKLKLPPLVVLNFLFRYDSETGKLYKVRGSSGRLCIPEREITTVAGNGYLIVGITDSSGLLKTFKLHQIIYYMCSGEEPLSVVDHHDGNKLNNKFDNLRLTNQSGNMRNKGMSRNNTSGITGVVWSKGNRKWRAQAYDNSGKQKHLGYFDDIHDAANVVQAHYSNPNNGYSERHGASV